MLLKESKPWDEWHPYEGLVNSAKYSILLLKTPSLFIMLLALLELSYKF